MEDINNYCPLLKYDGHESGLIRCGFGMFSEVKTYGSIYGAVQEDKPDKERLGLSDILGRRAVIYVFPQQLLIPSWPQHSGAYVGLKGQAGCVVAGTFFFFSLLLFL